eukprot:TCONS_00031664-protein
MKTCKKVWHTAVVEKNDPKAELNKTLQMYHATPHPTTGKAPAELLFGRKFHSRLPQQDETASRKDITEAREKEIAQKMKQSHYKDNKHHNIQLGDTVLLKQKSTKSKPPFDPSPYEVISINGHQITAAQPDRTITRDAQKWKIYKKPENQRQQQEHADEDNRNTQKQWDFEEPTPPQQVLLQRDGEVANPVPQHEDVQPIRHDF